jgi:hypothetical protein
MILTFDNCRYYLDLDKATEETRVKLPDGIVVKVGKWFPTAPPKPVNWSETDEPETHVAIPAGKTEVTTFTNARTSKAWHGMLKLKSPILIYRQYSFADFMRHTEDGLKQEMISDVVSDYDGWVQFAIGEYNLVGYERPRWIHIEAELKLRTSFNAASRRRAARSGIR